MANQYVNKVVAGNRTLIDISGDSVAADKLLNGYTAHDGSGAQVTGSVAFSTIHTSSSAPTSAQGADGDIWLVV